MASVLRLGKELLIGYVITLKLKEIVETNLPAITLPSPSQSLDSSLIINIENELNEARRYEASFLRATNKSIFRVPKSLRDVDENSYTPQIVSIGPYHLGDSNLREMDRHKWRALRHALDRTGHNVRLYLDAVRSLENRIRACYEPLKIPPTHDFILWLVLDSIFVLELFLSVNLGFRSLGYAPTDPVFTYRGDIIFSLQRDMILLENQLPLFLLDRILALQCGDKLYLSSRVTPLFLSFFKKLKPTNDRSQSTLPFDPLSNAGALHCLDAFYRNLFLASPKKDFNNGIFRQNCLDSKMHFMEDSHCASELQVAGIKFHRKETDQFWDIQFQFNDGVLKIPRLYINDHSKSLFSNLIAYELYHLESDKKIFSYICIMNMLIKSEVDVKCLSDQGIIHHSLKNDGEVVNLFNHVCLTLAVEMTDNSLLEIIKNVNVYYHEKWHTWRSSNFKKKWSTWKASLKKEYFSNPWTFISLIAATILLLLTFAQTFYAIYDHYNPN